MLHMLIEHFYLQNAANFCQRFQMINVNDIRPKCIIQNCTNALQIRSKIIGGNVEFSSWATIQFILRQLIGWFWKKLVKQPMFVLAYVHHKCARWPNQSTMVSFVRGGQIFNCSFYFRTHYLKIIKEESTIHQHQVTARHGKKNLLPPAVSNTFCVFRLKANRIQHFVRVDFQQAR